MAVRPLGGGVVAFAVISVAAALDVLSSAVWLRGAVEGTACLSHFCGLLFITYLIRILNLCSQPAVSLDYLSYVTKKIVNLT